MKTVEPFDFTSSCAWQPTHLDTELCTSSFFSFTSNPWTDNEAYKCNMSKVLICKSNNVLGFKFGPFTSKPQSWHKFSETPLYPTLLHPGMRIRGYVGHAVDSSGKEIGFPPLHMHHIHVHKQTKREVASGFMFDKHADFHLYQTHGDYLSKRHDGRAISDYFKFVPGVFCFVIESDPELAIKTYGTVNDMRAKHLAALDIAFYVEVSFLISDVACKPASYIWLHNPDNSLDNQPLPIYFPMHREPTPQNFYDVLNVTSVSWFTSLMPTAGNLLPGAWSHVHRLRDGGLFLLASSPFELQLCESSNIMVRRAEYASLREGGLDAERSRLLNHTALICNSDPKYSFVTAMGTDDGILNGSHWDRNGDFRCKEWSFKQGDPWTIVAFHVVNWQPQLEHAPMHTFIAFYFEAKDGSSLDWVAFGDSFNSCVSAKHVDVYAVAHYFRINILLACCAALFITSVKSQALFF